MSIGKNDRSNLPSDPLIMAKGGHEAANAPAVAFQNILDHGNASITQGYSQNPVCHPFHPAANGHTKLSDLWACTPVQKKASRHLHQTWKGFIS